MRQVKPSIERSPRHVSITTKAESGGLRRRGLTVGIHNVQTAGDGADDHAADLETEKHDRYVPSKLSEQQAIERDAEAIEAHAAEDEPHRGSILAYHCSPWSC